MPNPVPSHPFSRMALTSQDRVRIDGIVYHVLSADRNGVVLARTDGEGLHEGFTHDELYRLLDTDRLLVDRSFFSPGKTRLRLIQGDLTLADLTEEDRRWTNYKHEFVLRFLRQRAADRKLRFSGPTAEAAIQRIGAEMSKLGLNGKKRRCGKRRKTSGTDEPFDQPSPSQLREWIDRYEEGGHEAAALIDRTHRSGNRLPRLHPEVRGVMNELVPTYASSIRPSGPEIHSRIEEAINGLNADRKAAGQPLLEIPSLKAVYRAIEKLDPFHVEAGRETEKYARRRFFVVHEGVATTRLLERVEMDEWQVSLATLLVDTKLWREMTPEEREAVERVRVWLTAAIDCASRCILTLHISPDPPSVASAIAGLRMVIADKTALSPAWFMRGTPETVVTDRGSAFIHDFFRSTLADLWVTHQLAPAGLPQMRGTIERLFRTIDSRLIARFSGRTFSNVQDRGGYESEAQASLTVDQLRQSLSHFVAEYHNTPHEGLGGETPLNAWIRLSRECAVRPPPSPNQARHIFGIRANRRIGNHGIRFLGLCYQSLQVQRHRRLLDQKAALVRIDPDDLGQISVFTDEGWISVPCVEAFAQGLSVSEWTAATRRLRERFAEQAALARPAVLDAIKAVRDMSEAAIACAGIKPPVMSIEELNKAERELYRTFRIRGSGAVPSDEDDVLGTGGRIDDAPFTEDDEHDVPGDGITSPYGDADDWSLED